MTDQCETFGTLKLFHKKLQNTEKGEKKGKKLKQKNREDFARYKSTTYKSQPFIHQIKRKNNLFLHILYVHIYIFL